MKTLNQKIPVLFFLFLITIIPFNLQAATNAAPMTINFQGVMTDDGGNILLDKQEDDVTFSIVDGAGTVLYSETQHVYFVHGAISVLVGEGDDVTTGEPTGGIPYDALAPDGGDRLLRIKLGDQSIPQEDLILVSVPYTYYAQYANELSNPIKSDRIEDGTIQQEDLSAELLAYFDASISGVSQADLETHKTSFGEHSSGYFIKQHF